MQGERTIKLPVDRNLYIIGRMTCESVTDIIKSINDIRQSDLSLSYEYRSLGAKYIPNPIMLFVNSYGGEVYPSLGLVSLMTTSSENLPEGVVRTDIDTFCLGIAASMAFIVFISGRNKHCTPYSSFMVHELFNVGIGAPKDLVTTAEESVRLQKVLKNITISKTGITSRKFDAEITKRGDWWFDTEEAKKLNVITSILV